MILGNASGLMNVVGEYFMVQVVNYIGTKQDDKTFT